MKNQTEEKVHTDIFEARAAKVSNSTLSSIMSTVQTEAINRLGLQDLVDGVSKDVKTNYRKSIIQRAVLPSMVSSTPFPRRSDVENSKHSFSGSPILSNSLGQSHSLEKTRTQERHEKSFHKNIDKSIKSQNNSAENLPPPLEKFHPDDRSNMDIEEPSPSGIHGRKTQEPTHFNGRRLTSNLTHMNNSKENLPDYRPDTNTCNSKNKTNAKSILNRKSFVNKKQTFITDAKSFKKDIDSESMSESENRYPEKREREIVNSEDYRIPDVPEHLNNSSTSSNNYTFRKYLKGGRLENLKSSTFKQTYMNDRSRLPVEKEMRRKCSEAFPIEKFSKSQIRRSKSVPHKRMRNDLIDNYSKNKIKKKHHHHYQYVDVISDDSDVSQEVRIRRSRKIYESPKRRYLLRVRSSSESEDLQDIRYRKKALPLEYEPIDDRFERRRYSTSSSPHRELVEEGRKNRILKRYEYNPIIRSRRRKKERNKYRSISNYADMKDNYRVTNQENELIFNHHDKEKTHKKTRVIHQNTDEQEYNMLHERSKKMQENNKTQNKVPSFSEGSDVSHETEVNEAEISLLDAIFELIGDQKKKRKEYPISREVYKERVGKPLEIQGRSQQQSAQHREVKKNQHVPNKLSQKYNNIGEDMDFEVQSPPKLNGTNSQRNSPEKLLGNFISNQLENHNDNIIVLQNVTIEKKRPVIADETQQEINFELVCNNTTNEVDTVKKDVFAKPIRPPRRMKSHVSKAELNINADKLNTDPGIQQETREHSKNIVLDSKLDSKPDSKPESTDSSTVSRRSNRQKKDVLPFWLKSGNLKAESESKNSSKNLHPVKGKNKSLERSTRATTNNPKNMCKTAAKMTGPVTTSNNIEEKNKQSVASQKKKKEVSDPDKSLESSECALPKTTEDEKESTSQTYFEGEGIISNKSTPIDQLNKKESITKNTKRKRTRKKQPSLIPPHKRKNKSSKLKKNTKGSPVAVEPTRKSSRRKDAHKECEADVQAPLQIDNGDAGDFEFADDNHKSLLEMLPEEKANSDKKRRSTESSNSPERKNNKKSPLREQAHDDERNSPERLEKFPQKFNDLLKELRGSCSLTKCSGFLSLAPAEFYHLFNSEYAQRYTRLQGTNSLKIGAFQVEKSPDVFLIPKGITAEIENTGSQHVAFFIHYYK